MKNNNINFNFRYNILSFLVYIIGIVLIIQLFILQIVNGEEYRETSNSRLTRESTIEAARGDIEDRNGNILATTKTGYSVELYKTKNSNDDLNHIALKIVNLLEKNNDSYINNFPIDSNLKFIFSTEEDIKKWKEKYKITDANNEEECIEKFKEKYSIQNTNINDVMKIISIRYEITINGYSSTKSVKIAENISKESAIQFNEQNSSFPGINIIEEPIREYTKGSLAANIIGYIRKIDDAELKIKAKLGYKINDYIGKMGIEYVLEKYLKGTKGTKQIDMSVDGTVEGEYLIDEAYSGNTVVLTIDADLQQTMEETIEESVKKLQSEGKNSSYGAAVLMNVNNGEVLAMCSYPSFEPQMFINGLSNEEWKIINETGGLYDKAIRTQTPPGSTFKMAVATAALEEGAVTEKEYINDRGVYPYGHNPVCWYYTSYHRGHGEVNVKTALQKSCNYFFYEMGRRLGIDTIAKYAKFFKLGEKTGIELTNETSGVLASTSYAETIGKQWYLSDTLSASIGQSYNSFSTIQMARYISILANGGNNVLPTLIKEVKDVEGNRIPKEEIRKYTNELLGITENSNTEVSISAETLNIVKAGMRLVTSSGGTAYSVFKDFSKSVAGKTGSAQASTTRNGTNIKVANGWFVGFTPYEKPEVAVVVLLEDGASDSYAAKAAKKILDAYYHSDIENIEDLKEDMSAQIYTEN